MDIVDFHAHILPRADHGSTSTETSLFQINTALECGVSRIVATPHFYPQSDNVDAFISRRNASYAKLKTAFSGLRPSIKLGAEVLICENIEEMPGLELLCIEGTNNLLLELPFSDFFDSFEYSVKTLINRGYTVILAHADRYDPRNIDKLVAVGARLQLNADSLCKLIIPAHIKRWLHDKCVVAIGSDIHGSDKKAYLRFNKAVKKLGEYAAYIKDCSDSLYE